MEMMCPAGHVGRANITSLCLEGTTACCEAAHLFSFYMGCWSVKENKLADLSMEFAVEILNLVKELRGKRESVSSNQIGRSGTSIGANIREAKYAQSRNDFISKLEIALKEASETGYWLDLLYRTDYINQAQFKELSSHCATIRVLLIASCKTAKEKQL